MIEPPHALKTRPSFGRFGNVQFECVVGDLVDQTDVDALVNAANAELQPGGGVAGAIHRKAGPALARDCRPLAPIRPGQAVLTGGYRLPNPFVIHCLGPVYGVDEPAAQLLGDCYCNALKVANEQAIESVAFPAISTGAFGYPFVDATEVACRAILETIPRLRSVNLIRLVFLSGTSASIACTILSQLFRELTRHARPAK
ncbi:MAG TPA: macro domain-containing protein [Methylomirabilota bacterium]|nr:macro domain-containing protein [Methylomirabilota bacterium]